MSKRQIFKKIKQFLGVALGVILLVAIISCVAMVLSNRTVKLDATKLDVWYVDNISRVTDLKVIFISIKKVLCREDINSATSATMEFFDGTN